MPDSQPNVIQAVSLRVRDVHKLTAFYRDVIGLVILAESTDRCILVGRGGGHLELVASPTSELAAHSAGLFHVAWLHSTRYGLAQHLHRLIEHQVPLQGMSDHLVSEAIYLADPEGNGIEIYRDRPRDEWQFDGDSIRMATLPLNVRDLLSTPDTNEADSLRIGHVHLRVAEIPNTEKFYRETLGMDLMTRYGPAASFLSYGGYHHHLGINTWESRGQPAVPNALGLRDVTISLDLERYEKAKSVAGGDRLVDPSGNAIHIVDGREV